jgi:peptidoglycan/xylan/chitin deacetylase (PgdA/CDA1 family)
MRLLLSAAVIVAAVVPGSGSASAASCANPNALGVSRVIAVNPKVMPVVGGVDYGVRLPLAPGEVVLTFDDGPNAATTPAILRALADQCTRATFFMVGRQARAHPQTARQVQAAGHTIGTHTQNHPLGRLRGSRATYEIDAGIASVTAALGHAPAPFFRFPGLYRTREAENYLRQRDIMVWSVDVDSYDWKHNNTNVMLASSVSRLAARGGGILLMHDIKRRTAAVLPKLLAMLKARGLRVVHVVPRGGAPAALVARSHKEAPSLRTHSPNVVVADRVAAPGRRSTTAKLDTHAVVAKNNFESIFTPGGQRR